MSSGIMLNEAYDRQIRDLISRDRGSHRMLNELEGKQSKKQPSRFPQKAVVLDAELAAPTDAKEPTSVKATVLRWSVADSEYVETDEKIDVFNHGEGLTHAIGAFGAVLPINGHYWFFALAAGGEGDGCCCTCVCVEATLLLEIDSVQIRSSRNWRIELDEPSTWAPTNDSTGEVRLLAGTYELAWNESTALWEGVINSGSIEYRDNDGNAATPSSASGTISSEWEGFALGDLEYVDFTFDAVE